MTFVAKDLDFGEDQNNYLGLGEDVEDSVTEFNRGSH